MGGSFLCLLCWFHPSEHCTQRSSRTWGFLATQAPDRGALTRGKATQGPIALAQTKAENRGQICVTQDHTDLPSAPESQRHKSTSDIFTSPPAAQPAGFLGRAAAPRPPCLLAGRAAENSIFKKTRSTRTPTQQRADDTPASSHFPSSERGHRLTHPAQLRGPEPATSTRQSTRASRNTNISGVFVNLYSILSIFFFITAENV